MLRWIQVSGQSEQNAGKRVCGAAAALETELGPGSRQMNNENELLLLLLRCCCLPLFALALTSSVLGTQDDRWTSAVRGE